MGEDLTFDSILSDKEVAALFSNEEDNPKENKPSESEKKIEEQHEEKQDKTTEDFNPEDLLDVKSESVSSEENNKDTENPSSNKGGASPNQNFYSSITKAFVEDGVFSDLNPDEINDANSFKEAIEKQIQAQLDDRQKRIDEALNLGVEPTKIQQYESANDFLASITDEAISEEGEQGEDLRRRLIYQDFLNRGYTKERAEREIRKSFDAGTDIEDAKEALQSNIEYFNSQYNNLIQEAKDADKRFKEEQQKQADELRTSILEEDKAFGEIEIDKATRKKVFESISKPIYKDPDTGEYLTAIQKYAREHKTDYLKKLGLIFTLTDGFSSLDGLIKGKVKKEVSKGLANLERAINNTSRNGDGSLNFMANRNDDNAFFKGYRLDI